ncbi:hypothetical protein DFH09DRAFT_1194615 [Mycena vulgaris]|nr:hypothetical protein DFH09DRAFT_1194615 [Mycena vulgaris]
MTAHTDSLGPTWPSPRFRAYRRLHRYSGPPRTPRASLTHTVRPGHSPRALLMPTSTPSPLTLPLPRIVPAAPIDGDPGTAREGAGEEVPQLERRKGRGCAQEDVLCESSLPVRQRRAGVMDTARGEETGGEGRCADSEGDVVCRVSSTRRRIFTVLAPAEGNPLPVLLPARATNPVPARPPSESEGGGAGGCGFLLSGALLVPQLHTRYL